MKGEGTSKLGLTRLGRERTSQLSTFASQSHLRKRSRNICDFFFATKFLSRLALNVKEEASRALEGAEPQAASARLSVTSCYLPAHFNNKRHKLVNQMLNKVLYA